MHEVQHGGRALGHWNDVCQSEMPRGTVPSLTSQHRQRFLGEGGGASRGAGGRTCISNGEKRLMLSQKTLSTKNTFLLGNQINFKRSMGPSYMTGMVSPDVVIHQPSRAGGARLARIRSERNNTASRALAALVDVAEKAREENESVLATTGGYVCGAVDSNAAHLYRQSLGTDKKWTLFHPFPPGSEWAQKLFKDVQLVGPRSSENIKVVDVGGSLNLLSYLDFIEFVLSTMSKHHSRDSRSTQCPPLVSTVLILSRSEVPFLTVPVFKLTHPKYTTYADCNMAVIPVQSGLFSFLHGGDEKFALDHFLRIVTKTTQLYVNFVYVKDYSKFAHKNDHGFSIYLNRFCYETLAPECTSGTDNCVVGLQLLPKSCLYGISCQYGVLEPQMREKQKALLDVAGLVQWMVQLESFDLAPRYDGIDISRLLDEFILLFYAKRLVNLKEKVVFHDDNLCGWVFTPMVIQDNEEVKCLEAARVTQQTKNHVYADDACAYLFQCPLTKSVSDAQCILDMPTHDYHVEKFDWRESEAMDKEIEERTEEGIPMVLEKFVAMCKGNCFWGCGSQHDVIGRMCGMNAAYRLDWLHQLRTRFEKRVWRGGWPAKV